MLRQIVLWLLDYLEQKVDPDLKARIEAYTKQRAALEAEMTISVRQIESLNEGLVNTSLERKILEAELVKEQSAIFNLEKQIEQVRNEKTNLDSTSDRDLLRSDL